MIAAAFANTIFILIKLITTINSMASNNVFILSTRCVHSSKLKKGYFECLYTSYHLFINNIKNI